MRAIHRAVTLSDPPRIAASYVLAGSAERVHPASPGTGIPYPPEDLQFFVGAPSLDNYLFVGKTWSDLIGRYLKPKSRVLDIGCGSGRTARFLAENPDVDRYVGFDVVPEAVGWCQRFITPATSGRFRFELLDIQNAEFNPGGKVSPTEVSFPVADRSIEVAVAASVFPHLLESTALRYLAEVSRALVRRGAFVVSIHSENLVPWLPYNGTEARSDVFPPYFEGLASRYGLVLLDRIGSFCGQETFVFQSVI